MNGNKITCDENCAETTMLGVSETILGRRCEYSLPIGEDTYTTISDAELDNTISSIL